MEQGLLYNYSFIKKISSQFISYVIDIQCSSFQYIYSSLMLYYAWFFVWKLIKDETLDSDEIISDMDEILIMDEILWQ